MPTAPTPIGPSGPVPDRSDRDNFPTEMFDFHTWQSVTLAPGMNALADNVYDNAVEAAESATGAQTAETNAGAQAAAAVVSAATAAVSANLTVWITGTTYAAGAQAQDPGDSYAIYTRIIGGAGSTQPHLDTTNWRLSFPMGRPLAILTPTAAANVDALTAFTATYDNYLILVDGIVPASDDILRARFAVAGVVDSGANYGGATSFVFGGAAVNTFSTGVGMSAVAHVLNANDATNGKALSRAGVSQRDVTPTYDSFAISTMYTAANAVSGIRFYWSGGANFAAVGKIRIYGLNNI